MDTIFPDVNEFVPALNDGIYDWRRWSRWAGCRVNDGQYVDKKLQQNLQWLTKANNAGKLTGYLLYCVFPPSQENSTWQQTVTTFNNAIKNIRPGTGMWRRQVRFVDIEKWGRWSGDHSKDILAVWNALWQSAFAKRATWQRKTFGIRNYCMYLDQRRTGFYGNEGDLDELLPRHTRPKNAFIILANYTANPPYPGKVIHQFSSNYSIPGLGPVDVNTADGYSPSALAVRLGLSRVLVRL